jgi:hypothetical protein
MQPFLVCVLLRVPALLGARVWNRRVQRLDRHERGDASASLQPYASSLARPDRATSPVVAHMWEWVQNV